MENLTSMKDIGSAMKRLVRKDFSMSMKIPYGYMMKINATGSSTLSRDEPSVKVASPREEEKESKVSPRARATQHVGFSDPIAKAEARARKEERAVAQRLRPMSTVEEQRVQSVFSQSQDMPRLGSTEKGS